MALTITYDGYGVVANADSLTNDTGGSGTGDWKELGGGSYSLSPDASKYGVASIGSKYASKSGYTYIDGITPLDFSGGGTEEGQMIYIWVMMLSPTPLDTMANTPYNICMGDGTGSFNEYTVASKADSNGWDGRWKVFCIDPTITPTIDGGADISAIDTIGVWMDTDTSVRAESFYISQIMCARGLKVEGTSSTMYDDIVAWSEDYINRAAGMFQSRGQTYYSLGSLTIHSDNGSSNVSADGSNVEYEKSEFYNGSAWVTSYSTSGNVVTASDTSGNTVDFEEANIGVAGNDQNRISFDNSGALVYVKNGGYIKYMDTMASAIGHQYNGVVFSKYTARTLGEESYNNCTFDGSALITVGPTSDFASANIINGDVIISVHADDLAHVASNTFNGTGTNYGVALESIATDTAMTWSSYSTGFAAGVTGTDVATTGNNNETIWCSVADTKVLTINVAGGFGTPSVANLGLGSVNVVAGLVNFTFTVNPSITSYEYRLYSVTTAGSLAGSVELQGIESATQDSYTYSYSYTSDTVIALQVISQPDHDYEEYIEWYVLGSTDQSVSVNLDEDNNN